MRFNYRAKDKNAGYKDGTIEAINQTDALHKLQAEGLFIISLNALVTDEKEEIIKPGIEEAKIKEEREQESEANKELAEDAARKKILWGVVVLGCSEILLAAIAVPFFIFGSLAVIIGVIFFFTMPNESNWTFWIGMVTFCIASICLFTGWAGSGLLRLHDNARKVNLCIVPLWLFIILGWALYVPLQHILRPTSSGISSNIIILLGEYEPTLLSRLFLLALIVTIFVLPIGGVLWYLTHPQVKRAFCRTPK